MSDPAASRPRVDWRAADLRGVNMAGQALEGADLRASDLRGANFTGSNLRYVDLRGADLRGASFRNASLYAAKLQGADAREADFRGSDLRQANLSGAYLEGAMLPQPERIPPPAEAARDLPPQSQQQQGHGQARTPTFAPKAGAAPNNAHRAQFQRRDQDRGQDR